MPNDIQQVKLKTMANLIENPVKNPEVCPPSSNTQKKRTVLAKCLILLFVIITYILIGGFLFQYLEGASETVAKCGKLYNLSLRDKIFLITKEKILRYILKFQQTYVFCKFCSRDEEEKITMKYFIY